MNILNLIKQNYQYILIGLVILVLAVYIFNSCNKPAPVIDHTELLNIKMKYEDSVKMYSEIVVKLMNIATRDSVERAELYIANESLYKTIERLKSHYKADITGLINGYSTSKIDSIINSIPY